MNEKVGYLNVFSPGAGSNHATRSENIADFLPCPVFLLNTSSQRVEYANKKFNDPAGFSHVDKQPTGFLKSIFHAGDLAAILQIVSSDRLPVSGQLKQRKVRTADRFGRYRFHRMDGGLLPLPEPQEPRTIFFFAHDITDDLKSKEEIETTRELLDETEELLQFGSWAWEISTNIVTWTPGLYTLLEYEPRDIDGRIGLSFYLSHVLEEYQQNFRDLLQSALKTRSDFSYEYIIRTNSGALKSISTKGKLVKDESGEVVKMLCINRDITALRSFEKEQERNIRELNRSNRDLEEFAYIASHDLQEPLRKISMFTERLKAKYDKTLDKEGELFIERILASANNMRILIDNLLDFSRANRRSNTFDQVDIRSVLAGVISELELKIEETKASIEFTGTFPTIEAVTSEMSQVFSNILSNAIKFRKNDEPVRIEVRSNKVSRTEKHALGLTANQNFHKIEVQDNGIGFEPEYTEKIFQIFQRLNGKSEYPGSGIGLAICKKIVEKHNGLILAKGIPDQGAMFTIILPEKQF